MVKLIREGTYALIETNGTLKVLTIDGEKEFIWINAQGIGEILIPSSFSHRAYQLLARGVYRLYDVKNEPRLTDLPHLELFVGNGKWQGYLLPSGLPNDRERRNKIIPTREVITKSIS